MIVRNWCMQAAALLLLVLPLGCERSDPLSAQSPPKDHADTTTTSAWRMEENAIVVGLSAETEDKEMQAAIAEARRTAPQARERWEKTPEEDRQRWSIKWAAPTTNHEVEHVWVQPINWSRFRVEGVLLSDPVHELECGKFVSEIVSFPVEELSDWIFHPGDSGQHASSGFEGGYTVKVLEKRYGR